MMTTTMDVCYSSSSNISSPAPSSFSLLQCLPSSAPAEVLSNILALAGPSTALTTMTAVNRSWNRAAHDESTYEALCGALGKQKPSCPQSSWRTFYTENLYVPQDCSTIHQALERASHEFRRSATQVGKQVTIWLEAGAHYDIPHTLVVDIVGPEACLCIRTLDTAQQQQSPLPPQLQLPNPFLDFAAAVQDHQEDAIMEESDSDSSSCTSSSSCHCAPPPEQEHAVLKMDTKVSNQPLIHVKQGRLELYHVTLQHCSPVQLMMLILNQQNQNAALLLQSSITSNDVKDDSHYLVRKRKHNNTYNDIAVSKPQPSCHLEDVSITSYSGRGILNRSHGKITIADSFVARLW